MAYFKINGNDYSKYVNGLKIDTTHVYAGGTLSNGTDWAVLKATKHTINVSIIPLTAEAMATLQNDIKNFNIVVSYRDPITNELTEDLNCILPVNSVEYYTIRADKVLYKGLNLVIKEL